MNNFLESVPSNFMNNNNISTSISPNLSLLRKSKTLISNENESYFMEKRKNKTSINRHDKGARRLALFIQHFKRRAKSADPSSEAVYYGAVESRNNLNTNKNALHVNHPYTETLCQSKTNIYGINQKANSRNYSVQATSPTVPANNSHLSSGMSISAYETNNLINSQQIESQTYHRPRPASFHPSSQILTYHNPCSYLNNSVLSPNEDNCNHISPYSYCRIDNSLYMEPNHQTVNNVIMYDSIYDYPPNLSPYPCPTFIPSEDITPTNENVNLFPTNTQSRIRPTSVDFYRLRKMHQSMKQLFSFNGKKANITEQPLCNTRQLEENNIKRSSFTENSQSELPVISVNDNVARISLTDSSNRNLKRTILRSFSCNPRSNYDHRRKVKSHSLKSENVTVDNYDKTTELNNNSSLTKNDAQSQLHVISSLRTEPVNYITISSTDDKKPRQVNSRFSMMKSSSICQVSTCHNIPKLSTPTIQSENTKMMEFMNHNCANDMTKTTQTSFLNARCTTTTTTTTTTAPVQALFVTTSSIPLPLSSTATTFTGCLVDSTKFNLNYNNSNLLQSSSSSNTLVSHNKYLHYSKKSDRNHSDHATLSTYQSHQIFDNNKWNNNRSSNNSNNIENNRKTKHVISLSDYLSNTENSTFDKNTMANNTTRLNIFNTLSPMSDNSGNPNSFMSSSLFEPEINGTNDCFPLSRSDTFSHLKEFPERSKKVGYTEDHNKIMSIPKEYSNSSTLNCNLTRTKLLSNLPECSRFSQLYNSIGYENLKNDRFMKVVDSSRNVFPTVRSSCFKQTASLHSNNQSAVYSTAVLRPPRPPQRTTSLVRDHQFPRANGVNNTDASYSSRSSPSRNVISSNQDSNSQICPTTSCCKPLDNNMNNHLPDKLIDKEVSGLNSSDNDTVWWSHLLPYKPSNLPSNLADRLRQRNSLIISRSSPTTRLSNSSLPTSFPNNTKSSNNNNSNLQNIMIQSMYEHSDSGDYTGLRPDIASLYGIQNKHVNDTRLKQSRPISMHTDYSHYTNNAFFLPSLTHFNTTINSDTVTCSSPSALSSASISSLQQQQQQQQQQKTRTRPSSLSLTSSFTNVIPKLNNLMKTNKLHDALNSSKSTSSSLSSTSTTSETVTTNNSQSLLQSNTCNIIPDYLLKSCAPSDSPLLGQYCRLLLLRTNDDRADIIATDDHINDLNDEINNTISTPIEYSVKITPTAETPVTPV
ncbi:unnamed protein product [Schistosoma turkestanicum]|nr:unnamed protein product [Schistosoma turkestanicum]